MISRSIYNEMARFTGMNRFTAAEAKEMERLIRENFNPKYNVCVKCPQQIKHGQRLLQNFLNQVEVYDEPVLEEQPLFDFEPVEVSVDIEEAKKVGCTKCGRKKRTTKK